MALRDYFYDLVVSSVGFTLSQSQQRALESFSDFLFCGNRNSMFLLTGYAGTGKTSLIASIVNSLTAMEYNVILLAPTGRAAKVFSSYSRREAYTIHKNIYRQSGIEEGMEIFDLGFNKNRETLYFVDEASMISNSSFDSPFGSGSLLDDLLKFIHNGRDNRLILIGDAAQLPPVGTEMSPALDITELQSIYGFEVYHSSMTDIVRQAESSGILFNATILRNFIGEAGYPTLNIDNYPDIVKISGGDLLEELYSCYSNYGEEETIVICRSNKRANRFNQGIRASVLYMEEMLCGGDRIMVVKNNYYAAKGYDNIDFIANGEMATVVRVGKEQKLYGHHFAYVDMNLDDYEQEISGWVMLDTLTSDSPALTVEESREFYLSVEADYADIKSKKKKQEAIRENEFYNALQIKFAYAVTCHKAQGGQWDAVFIDQGYLVDDMLCNEYWRWMYTAFTRARKKLYLLNFSDKFFKP